MMLEPYYVPTRKKRSACETLTALSIAPKVVTGYSSFQSFKKRRVLVWVTITEIMSSESKSRKLSSAALITRRRGCDLKDVCAYE